MTQAERPPTSRISVRKKNAHQLFKTDMCKLFQQGVCRHGESCAFAHSADEVRHKPDLTRTSMCRTVLRGGICSDALCSFAHDQASLRTTCGFFKTRMCNYARSGKCRSSAACRFAHAPEELRSLAPPAPEEQGGGSTEQAHTWARGQPAEWSAGGSGGSGDSVSSGSSVAATVETRPPRRQRRVTAEDPGGGHAGRRPPSSGSSSGYGGGVSWASRVDPDSPKAPAAAPDGRRRGAAGGRSEPCSSIGATCLKVSHVPRYLRQEDLLSRLEEKFPALRESLDFFHCPWDDRARGNRGYALLNFENVERASRFQRCWANKELRPGAGEGRLRVESAKPQALAGSAGALNQELCCQPLVRDAGGALRPRHAELHGQVAQGGSWLFGQPGPRALGPAGAGAFHAGPASQGAHGPPDEGSAPGAGMCVWPLPLQGGVDYVASAATQAVQPVWPLQMGGQQRDLGPGEPAGEMLHGVECACVLMPVQLPGQLPVLMPVQMPVVGDTAGGGPQACSWSLAHAEDEIYSD